MPPTLDVPSPQPAGVPTVRDLWTANRRSLLTAYGLLGLESGLCLAQPLVIGRAINDLLGSSFRGLLLFAALRLLLLLVTAGRQMFNTRLFAALETECEIKRAAAGDRSARDEQRDAEPLERLEQTIPLRLRRLLTTGGAFLLLGWYDLTLLPFCLLLLLPLSLLRAACQPRLSWLSQQLQREQESASRPTDGEEPTRRRCQRGCRHWRVRLADAGAIQSALSQLFVLGMVTTAIVHYVGCSAAPPAGDIFAVVCYVLLYVTGCVPMSGRAHESDTGEQ